MDTLKDYELTLILGGGYWWHTPDGEWVYKENDEDLEGDDTI